MVPQVYTYAKGVPLLLNLTIMSPLDKENLTLQYIEVQKENIIVYNKGQTRNKLNYNTSYKNYPQLLPPLLLLVTPYPRPTKQSTVQKSHYKQIN